MEIEYPYRSKCKGCDSSDWCIISRNSKMNNRKCYIDFLAEKMKKKPKEVIMLWNRCVQGIDLSLEDIKCWFSADFFNDNPECPNWVAMTRAEKELSVADALLSFHGKHIAYLKKGKKKNVMYIINSGKMMNLKTI